MSIIKAMRELFAPVEEHPNVDVEYLETREYAFIETFAEIDEEELIRCNLCGKLFDKREMESAVSHVAGHDQEGAAEIDPFDTYGIEEDWRAGADDAV